MIFSEVKNINEFKPIYILKGDSHFAKIVIAEIEKKLGVDKMSTSIFNDENFDADMVICALQQFSFFGTKRLVIISNIYKDLKEKDVEKFLNYENSPNPDCVFLIDDTSNYGKFNFLTTCELIDCKAGETFSLGYISNKFKEQNIKISPLAVKKIYDYSLADFTRINLEIQKLIAYAINTKEVTDEDVENLVFKDTELKVFELTNALSVKNIKKAQAALFKMLKEGEPITKILALISNHFRRLFLVKINKDMASVDLAKKLGVKEYAITKAKENATSFSATELKQIEELCLEVDYMIKSGQMSQENAIYYLIYSIVNG